jgi:hypothetical protein
MAERLRHAAGVRVRWHGGGEGPGLSWAALSLSVDGEARPGQIRRARLGPRTRASSGRRGRGAPPAGRTGAQRRAPRRRPSAARPTAQLSARGDALNQAPRHPPARLDSRGHLPLNRRSAHHGIHRCFVWRPREDSRPRQAGLRPG